MAYTLQMKACVDKKMRDAIMKRDAKALGFARRSPYIQKNFSLEL